MGLYSLVGCGIGGDAESLGTATRRTWRKWVLRMRTGSV